MVNLNTTITVLIAGHSQRDCTSYDEVRAAMSRDGECEVTIPVLVRRRDDRLAVEMATGPHLAGALQEAARMAPGSALDVEYAGGGALSERLVVDRHLARLRALYELAGPDPGEAADGGRFFLRDDDVVYDYEEEA